MNRRSFLAALATAALPNLGTKPRVRWLHKPASLPLPPPPVAPTYAPGLDGSYAVRVVGPPPEHAYWTTASYWTLPEADEQRCGATVAPALPAAVYMRDFAHERLMCCARAL